MASYLWKGISGHWRKANNWNPAGGPPTASDAATINGSATDAITVNLADEANSLTLSDAKATLTIGGATASLTIGGALTMRAGTLNISRLGHGGVLTVGTLNLSGGSLNIGQGGELNLGGTLRQTGGSLDLDGSTTISGGTIESTGGDLEIFSACTLSGVTFDGSLNVEHDGASVELANGTTVVGSSGTGSGTINITGEATNLYFDNTQTVRNETINLGAESIYSPTLRENDTDAGDHTLTLALTVTINVTGDAGISTTYFSDRIVNQGVIDQSVSGGNLSIFEGAFTNIGAIDAEAMDGSFAISCKTFRNSGSLDVANGDIATVRPAVAGKGTDTISGGATLEFDAAVSSAATLGDQDIGFSTGGGTLDLLAPASFYGEISDFGLGDTVDLKGSWTFSAISQSGGVTTLTLASGGATHGFEFVGDYAQSNFSIAPGATTKIGYI